MDDRTLNLYLSRILSGYYIFIYNDKKYKLKYPDITIKYEADLLADQEFDKIKFNGWPTKESIVFDLIQVGLWTPGGDNELKRMDKQIEDTKVNLYLNHSNPIKLKSLRKNLQSYKNSYNKIYNRRHCFDHITIEGHCDNIRNYLILIHSIYDEDNNLIKNIDHDVMNFNNICSIISNNIIDIPTFKMIARSDIWRNYWSANKELIFNKSTIDWTDEQKTLVILTKMYDAAHESMDCPPDHVFEDDDMFDGWMIHQKRENEKTKNKNRLEKTLPGKLDKSGDVFLMARSKEEAQAIYSMNDTEANSIIKERQSVIRKNNVVKEQNLPDVQRGLILQSNEQRKNMRKS